MNMSISIAALVAGCSLAPAAVAQSAGTSPTSPPAVQVDVDDFIGPFAPTPQSRADARREAYAAYAWGSKACRESRRGQAQAQCLAQARHDRDAELAGANEGRRRSR